MKNVTYADVPALAQFRKDSSITFAIRDNDHVLAYIDHLLERYHKWSAGSDEHAYSMRRVVLCELFLTCNYWIKSFHEQRPMMKKERYPAVLGLFEAVVNKLTVLLGCTRPMVAYTIEEIFGREMTQAGISTDLRQNAAHFDRKTRAAFRLRFRAGRVYCYENYGTGSMRLKPANSIDFYTAVTRRGAGATIHGWAPFVMTLEREFFMTRHSLNESGRPNIFHSAYTAGGIVAAAGTWSIRDGVIDGIRPDSGHYQPTEHNIVGALLALAMFGVNLKKIAVYSWENGDQPIGKAIGVVRSGLSWPAYVAARQQFLATRGTGQPVSQPMAQPVGVQRPASGPVEPAFYNDPEDAYN